MWANIYVPSELYISIVNIAILIYNAKIGTNQTFFPMHIKDFPQIKLNRRPDGAATTTTTRYRGRVTLFY